MRGRARGGERERGRRRERRGGGGMHRLLLGFLEEDSRNEDGHDGEDDGGEVAHRALRVGGVEHRASDAAVQVSGFRTRLLFSTLGLGFWVRHLGEAPGLGSWARLLG